jgi:hypothetical protein
MSSWTRAVHKIDIPTAPDLATAINAGTGSPLQQLSNRIIAAANAPNQTADRRGQRAVSTTLRLGLLVDAESARAAQAATAIGDASQGGRSTEVARRLALIGDGLWPPALGPRHSGFNPDLLGQTGP